MFPAPISTSQLERLVDEYVDGMNRVCGAIVYKSDCDCDIPEGEKIEDAVRHATASLDKRGKKCRHQMRVAPVALKALYRELLPQIGHIENCTSFEALYDTVLLATTRIQGVGALTAYDVAVRIGCFLKLEPNVVYMHAGTCCGARHLGLAYTQTHLTMSELPEPLKQLPPAKVEDFLCIYKDRLGPIAAE